MNASAAAPLHDEPPAPFDTIFNSLELVSPDRVEVCVSRRHQRLSAPVIDKKAIDATWEELTRVVSLDRCEGGVLDATAASGCGTTKGTHRHGTDLPDGGQGVARQRLHDGPDLLAIAVRKAAMNGVTVDLPVTGNDDDDERESSTSEDRGPNPASSPVAGGVEGTSSSAAAAAAAATTQGSPKPFLFNGLKFRLHDVEICEGGPATQGAWGQAEGGRGPLPCASPARFSHTQPSTLGTAISAAPSTNPGAPILAGLSEDRRLLNAHEDIEEAVVLDGGTPPTRQISSAATPHPQLPPGLESGHYSLTHSAAPLVGRFSSSDGLPPETPTACPARPRNVLLCKLKLGITDYKTSMGTTTHVSRYEHYVSHRDRDFAILFGNEDGNEGGNTGAEKLAPCVADDHDAGGAAAGQPSPTTSEVGSLPRSLSMTLRNEELVSRAAFILRRTERYLANAIGVEALTVTSDNCAVLFRRSLDVSEYPGYYCCPGGHPEPSHIVNVSSFTSTPKNRYSTDLLQDGTVLQQEACSWFEHINGDVIVNELFRSVVVEVAEEIGVPQASCVNRGLVSIIRTAKSRKPDMCFVVDVACTNDEVRHIFNQRTALEAFESQEGSLVLMDLNRVRSAADVVAFTRERLNGRITPASFATLLHGIQCVRATSL